MEPGERRGIGSGVLPHRVVAKPREGDEFGPQTGREVAPVPRRDAPVGGAPGVLYRPGNDRYLGCDDEPEDDEEGRLGAFVAEP